MIVEGCYISGLFYYYNLSIHAKMPLPLKMNGLRRNDDQKLAFCLSLKKKADTCAGKFVFNNDLN